VAIEKVIKEKTAVRLQRARSALFDLHRSQLLTEWRKLLFGWHAAWKSYLGIPGNPLQATWFSIANRFQDSPANAHSSDTFTCCWRWSLPIIAVAAWKVAWVTTTRRIDSGNISPTGRSGRSGTGDRDDEAKPRKRASDWSSFFPGGRCRDRLNRPFSLVLRSDRSREAGGRRDPRAVRGNGPSAASALVATRRTASLL